VPVDLLLLYRRIVDPLGPYAAAVFRVLEDTATLFMLLDSSST